MIRAILQTFLPEKIGSYYLLPKRIIGIDITKANIYATQIYCAGNRITLERFVNYHLENNAASYTERVGNGLKIILGQLDKADEIRSSINSSFIIFKELTLPFIDYEKIESVLPFEIEGTLPFSAHDAIIDFIITKQDLTAKTSTIMSAAIMKQYVAEHLQYFIAAGIEPNTITIDLFDLYTLFKIIPDYAQQMEGIVFIDIGIQSTRMAYVINGQLKLIRTINKGLAHIAKSAGTHLNMSNGQALEEILRFGFEKNNDTAYKEAVQQAFVSFWRETEFTLQSFTAQLGSDHTINHILLLGEGSEISNIDQLVEKTLHIPCKFFDANKLLKNPFIELKQAVRIDRLYSTSLSTALSALFIPDFNLRKKEFQPSTTGAFSKQFFTGIALLGLIFVSLFLHSFLQTRKLQKVATAMEQEVVAALRDRGLTQERNVTKAIEDAEATVTKDEELWFAFSRQTRFSFLKALQDLSLTIDRKSVGLNLKKLIITENTIGIEAEVKGYEELKILERELRESNLFINVPTLQDLKINERLPLKKNGTEAGT